MNILHARSLGGTYRRFCTRSLDQKRQVNGTLRSEEHTSELQSRLHLVCRLLLEKKKKKHVIKNCETTAMIRLNHTTKIKFFSTISTKTSSLISESLLHVWTVSNTSQLDHSQ